LKVETWCYVEVLVLFHAFVELQSIVLALILLLTVVVFAEWWFRDILGTVLLCKMRKVAAEPESLV